jgi:hypothetical protein
MKFISPFLINSLQHHQKCIHGIVFNENETPIIENGPSIILMQIAITHLLDSG